MKAQWVVLASLLLGLMVVGCGAQEADHLAVVESYNQAVIAGDAEAALAQFTDDATLTTPWGNFAGKEELRGWVLQEIDFFADGAEILEKVNVQESGDSLEFDERLKSEGKGSELHHTFLMEDGKIKEWTIVPK